MKEILDSFLKSLSRFEEILKEDKTVANRDSAINRFEITFELAWKSLKKFLQTQGIVCRSPKSCFQEGFKLDLIRDDFLWIKMMEDRNLTAHTYDEKTADQIYDHLSDYLKLFSSLRGKLQ